MNKTVSKIKKIGGSPLFLIAALAYIAALVTQAIGSQAQASAIGTAIQTAMGANYDTIGDRVGMITSAFPWASIATSLLGILVGVGMLIHFISSRSSSNPPSTGGMTLIKVVEVINFISLILTALIILVIEAITVFTLLFGATEIVGETPTALIIGCIVAVVLTVLVFIFMIMYYTGIFKTIKSVKMTLSTGVIMGKVSLYVIVINYIMAFCYLIGAVFTRDIVLMISGLAMTLSLVTCSISLASLRSEMRYIASRGGEAIS